MSSFLNQLLAFLLIAGSTIGTVSFSQSLPSVHQSLHREGFDEFLSGHFHGWGNHSAANSSGSDDETVYAFSFSNALINIDAAQFKFKLEELSGARETMVRGQTQRISERGSVGGRNLARQWLEERYQRLGFEVTLHNYGSGSNLVAERSGKSGRFLVLSSHFDSVGNAGANDDGSGTIAALLIAEQLKDSPLEHGLRIVAFDEEEGGLIGSGHYVRQLPHGEVIANIQLEMMAYNSRQDGRFHVIDCDRADSQFLSEAIMRKVQETGLPLTRVEACTQASDHSRFWRAGIPAVAVSENFFGGDGDRCYHRSCDVVDSRLDFGYASRIAMAVGSTLLELLQSQQFELLF